MRDTEFDRLYAEHAQALFGFLVYRTGDRAFAEDVLADTFERALRARARFDPRRGSRKRWLYAIALNCLRDSLRRRATEQRAVARVGALSPASAVDPALEAVAENDTLQRAIRELSDEHREAIALRFGADLSLREIARVLGVPRTTVEARLYGALRRLRGLVNVDDAR